MFVVSIRPTVRGGGVGDDENTLDTAKTTTLYCLPTLRQVRSAVGGGGRGRDGKDRGLLRAVEKCASAVANPS